MIKFNNKDKLNPTNNSLYVSYLRNVQISCGTYPYPEDIHNLIIEIKNNLSQKLEKATNVYGGMTDWEFFNNHPIFLKFLTWFINTHQISNHELKNFHEFKFLKEAWGNELKKGHSVQIHDHFDYHGILYLTKGSPLIVPELNLTILPEPGDYYFFPPNIKHYVPEVQTDETRYSVVFNIALKLDWDKKKRLNLNNEVS
tara:strand:- start:6145 stop:6741 length:597 start_codon:yes stop_codon:yes gene_type:complete